MPIKVVSIVSRMNLGGVAVLLVDLHQMLPGAEFSHTLITGVCGENEIDMLDGKYEDPNIIQIPTMGRKPSLRADLLTFAKLRNILKQLAPDVVHTHTSKAGVLGRLAAFSLRKKIIIVHSYHGHHLYGYFSKIIVKSMVITERFLAYLTPLLIADSNQVMLDLQEVGIGKKSKWQVIPPGIRKLEKLSRDEARLNIKIESDVFLISWVGRFTDIKNPKLALEVLLYLKGIEQEKYVLIMVGEGELMQECKDFNEQNHLGVVFPGWESKVSQYLAASDLLLVTSKNEGFGMVIAEAGFQNVPSVATDVGGVREFIVDQFNGVLVPNDAISIAKTIDALAKNRGNLEKLGNMARKTTLEKFIIAQFVENHKASYRNFSV